MKMTDQAPDKFRFMGTLEVGKIADAYTQETDIACPFCSRHLVFSPRQEGLSRSGDTWHVQKAFFECRNEDCARFDEAFAVDAVNQHAAATGAKFRG